MTDQSKKIVILSGDNPEFREKLKSLIEAHGLEVASEADSEKILLIDDFPRLDPLVLKTLDPEDLYTTIGLKDNQPWYNKFRKSKY